MAEEEAANGPDYVRTAGRQYVQMTLFQDGGPLGDLIIELYSDVCPNTCKHFVSLVNGDDGRMYTGSPIHRVVKRGYIQGGDVYNGSGAGAGGLSIPDETFSVKHDQLGIVGLANVQGRAHTAYCQFYITQSALTWLDGKSVAFGKVVNEAGLALVKALDNTTTLNERPVPEVTVKECIMI